MRGAAAASVAALLSIVAMLPWKTPGGLPAPFGAGAAHAASASQNPCAAPTKISPNIDETAWQLWVAATCPVNQNQYPFVVWENWIEQAQLYPADPSKGLWGAEFRPRAVTG